MDIVDKLRSRATEENDPLLQKAAEQIASMRETLRQIGDNAWSPYYIKELVERELT